MTSTEFGIVVFTVVSAATLLHQAWKVWSIRRADSLDAPQMFVALLGFVSLAVYGAQRELATMLFSGALRVPFCAVILVGIFVFGTVTPREWGYCAGIAAVTYALFIVPPRFVDDLFLGISIALVLACTRMPMKIRRSGTRGVVQLPMLLVYDLMAVYWVLYGLAHRDVIVWLPSLAFCLIYTYTIHLWWISPPLPTRIPDS